MNFNLSFASIHAFLCARSTHLWFIAVLFAFGLPCPAYATNVSSADPNYPATFDDIDAGPLRDQFNRFINDVDNLWAAIGPNFLEANQILGALLSGKAIPLSVPSCSGPENALIWTPGIGFGCNVIVGGGGAALGPQAAYTVLAGPLGGPAAIPTARALTGNDLPLPSLNSVGGVRSIAPVAHSFITGISTSGMPSAAAPSFADISGVASASQLPSPTAASLGGVESIAVIPHNFLTGVSLLGVPTQAQPSFGDMIGNIGVTQMASGSGATSSTFWSGDGTWKTPTGSGTVNSGTANTIAGYLANGAAVASLAMGSDIAVSGGVVNFVQAPDRNVITPTDTITSADCGGTVVYNRSSSIAVSIAAASSTGLTQGCGFTVNNKGSATATITPTTSTIAGSTSLPIPPSTGCYIRSDSINFLVDYSACSALTLPAGSLATTPADNATCTAGQTWFDTGFVYLCVSSGTVKRAALSTY